MGKKARYKNTIMQTRKECYFCHRDDIPLDHHEFLNGINKQLAIADDLWVWVCRRCHTLYQNDDEVMNKGRKASQEAYEKYKGTRIQYFDRYKKNYVDCVIVRS